MKNTKVISINNQKGGVGKTTTALTMSAVLAEAGKKVLLIDCDGSSTTLTKILTKQVEGYGEENLTLTDLMLAQIMDRSISAEDAEGVVIKTAEGIDLLPADNKLVSVATNLNMQNDLEKRFKTLSNIVAIFKGKYDYILLDAAPVLDLFSLNQLIAADEVIIVSQCQGASRDGMSEMLNSIKSFALQVNPSLKIKGILMTMYDTRTKYSGQASDEIIKEFGEMGLNVFKTVIPRSVEAEKYVENGASLLKMFPDGKVTKAYKGFVEEYLKKE